MQNDKSNTSSRLKRCFVTGSSGPALNALVKMLEDRDIDTTSADKISAGSIITDEILRLISSSDFLAVVFDMADCSNAIYELGVARGLGKPAFVVVVDRTLDLKSSGVYVRALKSLEAISDVADDLDRFLRNAKAPIPIEQIPDEEGRVSLDWAKQALATMRSDKTSHRALDFERLVGKIFKAAGAEVLPAQPSKDEGIDLIVWYDQVAGQTGGPLLIECKLLQGGSGSVIKNSEAWVRRLNRTVEGTKSGLALLIYDHDRPRQISSFYETPRVLSFAIEDLIENLEQGVLAKTLLRRREIAAFARGRPE